MKSSITRILLLTGAVLCALQSCVTQKRCFEKFPPQVVTVVEYDTIVTYKSDTIQIHVKGDTVVVTDTLIVPADGEPFSADTIRAEVKYAFAGAWVSNGLLGLMLVQRDTMIVAERDSLISQISYYKKLYEQVIVEKPVNKVPWYYRILPFVVVALLLLLTLVLLFRH